MFLLCLQRRRRRRRRRRQETGVYGRAREPWNGVRRNSADLQLSKTFPVR